MMQLIIIILHCRSLQNILEYPLPVHNYYYASKYTCTVHVCLVSNCMLKICQNIRQMLGHMPSAKLLFLCRRCQNSANSGAKTAKLATLYTRPREKRATAGISKPEHENV